MYTTRMAVIMEDCVVGAVAAAGGGGGVRIGGALLVPEHGSVLSTASSIWITSHTAGLVFGSGSTHLSPVEMHSLTCWMAASRGVCSCSAFSSRRLQFRVT